VLRVNTRDRGSLQFQNECLAYERLAQQALPVPKVLVLDDSHALLPYDDLITTRLPGGALASSWQRLPGERLQALIYEAGQCLDRVHGCTFPSYGKLHALNDASWTDYVQAYVEPYLREASDEGLLDAALRTAVERALDHAMGDWEGAQPALIHCDFHYENVLHVDGTLSGLLDFEWALAGDPAYDFCIDHRRLYRPQPGRPSQP
jgi:aminoglycoside phosphotransferase (APT) family kinase protein